MTSSGRVCHAPGCSNTPEPKEDFCLDCQLDGHAPLKQTSAFQRDGRDVILLTLREGTALLEFITRLTTRGEQHADTDLGVAIRVLDHQVTYLQPITHRGRGAPFKHAP